MKAQLAFVCLLFLTGCTAQVRIEPVDVVFMDVSHTTFFSVENNKTRDEISFVIQNNESFTVECDVFLNLNNFTNSTAKMGKVGILLPSEKKNVSLKFEMFDGITDLSINPRCIHS